MCMSVCIHVHQDTTRNRLHVPIEQKYHFEFRYELYGGNLKLKKYFVKWIWIRWTTLCLSWSTVYRIAGNIRWCKLSRNCLSRRNFRGFDLRVTERTMCRKHYACYRTMTSLFRRLFNFSRFLFSRRLIYLRKTHRAKISRYTVCSTQAYLPIDITHFGSGIWSYIFRSAGAVLFETVPATIITSDCRGLPRKKDPKRSRSYLGANASIISMAQQANP